MSTTLGEITIFDDLVPQEFVFEYLGKRYVLHEASGAIAKKFQNERTNRFKLNSNGKIEGVRDAADLAPMLVAWLCKTSEGSSLPQTLIESWPDRLVQKLFQKAKEISGIDEAVLTPADIVSSLLKEPGCPIDKKEFSEWIKTVQGEKYEGLKKKFLEPTSKES
jgi:hypothetical protein